MSLPVEHREKLLREKTESVENRGKWKEKLLYIDSAIKYRVVAYPVALWGLAKDVGGWIWDVLKKVGRVVVAYSKSMWFGSIFPVKGMTITNEGETYIMRSVAVGRGMALATVSVLYSWKIGFLEYKGYVPFFFLFVAYLVSQSELVLEGMKLSFVAFQLGFLVFGVWRAKEFPGLKRLLVGKLNEASGSKEEPEE